MADNTGNKYRGEYRTEFAGKKLAFRLGFTQLVAVEALVGRSIVEMATSPEGLRVEQLVEILALGVEGADGSVDRNWIRDQMPAAGIMELSKIAGALLTTALMGADDGEATDRPGKPKAATAAD